MDENRFPLSGIEQIFIDLSSLDLAILSSDLFRLRRYSPHQKQWKLIMLSCRCISTAVLISLRWNCGRFLFDSHPFSNALSLSIINNSWYKIFWNWRQRFLQKYSQQKLWFLIPPYNVNFYRERERERRKTAAKKIIRPKPCVSVYT